MNKLIFRHIIIPICILAVNIENNAREFHIWLEQVPIVTEEEKEILWNDWVAS